MELQNVAGTLGEDASAARDYLVELEVPYVPDAPVETVAPPRTIVFGTIDQLADLLPSELVASYGGLAMWVVSDAFQEDVFARIPETDLPADHLAALGQVISGFARDRQAELAKLLRTDQWSSGFHAGGATANVRAFFDQEGFELVGRIANGAIEAVQMPS